MISADRFYKFNFNKINVNGSAHTFRAEKLDFKIITNIKIAFIVHFIFSSKTKQVGFHNIS